jgi:hypothetical protein
MTLIVMKPLAKFLVVVTSVSCMGLVAVVPAASAAVGDPSAPADAPLSGIPVVNQLPTVFIPLGPGHCCAL